MSQAFHRGEYPDDWGAIAMTPTDLLAIMRESGLPEAVWPFGHAATTGKRTTSHMLMSSGGTILNIDEAAALCEVALRRAIREAVGIEGAFIKTRWCRERVRWEAESILGEAFADSELHALARLHAAVAKENSDA